MNALSLPITMALLALPLAAQTSYTSPKGMDNTQGNNVFYHWAGARVMQVVDNTNLTPRPLFQLSFRQATGAYSSATPGTMDLVLTMAQTPWGMVDEMFADNYTSNKLVVFSGKINIPDWTQAPTATPSPFNFTIKFTKPWVYKGVTALVWHVDYKNSTAGTHKMDRAFGTYGYNLGTGLGTGCGGYTGYLRLWNTGNYHPSSGMHFQIGATGGPKSAPSWLLIDSKDSALAIKGLCTKLHALPTIILPVGNTDATGLLSHKYLNFPYIPAIQNGKFVTQIMSLDTTQSGLPFSLTDGRQATMPSNSSTNGYAACYSWESGSGATHSNGHYIFFGGCPVTEIK